MITFNEWKQIAGTNPERFFTEFNAKSYIPLESKLKDIQIAVKEFDMQEGDKIVTTPPLCIGRDETGFATIKTIQRYLFLMFIYLTEYFEVVFEGNDFATQDYDEIIRCGYQARINRLADKATTSKIKRLVIAQQSDFKMFEKMLNKELADEVARINDPQKRLADMPQAIIDAILARINSDVTPERMQEATAEIKNIIAEVEKQKALKGE